MPVKSIRFPNQTTYDGKITSLTEKEKDDKIELTTSNGIGVTKFSKHMEERASERKV